MSPIRTCTTEFTDASENDADELRLAARDDLVGWPSEDSTWKDGNNCAISENEGMNECLSDHEDNLKESALARIKKQYGTYMLGYHSVYVFLLSLLHFHYHFRFVYSSSHFTNYPYCVVSRYIIMWNMPWLNTFAIHTIILPMPDNLPLWFINKFYPFVLIVSKRIHFVKNKKHFGEKTLKLIHTFQVPNFVITIYNPIVQ